MFNEQEEKELYEISSPKVLVESENDYKSPVESKLEHLRSFISPEKGGVFDLSESDAEEEIKEEESCDQ